MSLQNISHLDYIEHSKKLSEKNRWSGKPEKIFRIIVDKSDRLSSLSNGKSSISQGRQTWGIGRVCQPVIWQNFGRKLHENVRIWTERGARVPSAPLGSASGGSVRSIGALLHHCVNFWFHTFVLVFLSQCINNHYKTIYGRLRILFFTLFSLIGTMTFKQFRICDFSQETQSTLSNRLTLRNVKRKNMFWQLRQLFNSLTSVCLQQNSCGRCGIRQMRKTNQMKGIRRGSKQKPTGYR